MYVFEVPLVMIAHDAFSWWQKEGNEARFETRLYRYSTFRKYTTIGTSLASCNVSLAKRGGREGRKEGKEKRRGVDALSQVSEVKSGRERGRERISLSEKKEERGMKGTELLSERSGKGRKEIERGG